MYHQFSDTSRTGTSGRKTSDTNATASVAAVLGPQPAIAYFTYLAAALGLRWKSLLVSGVGQNHVCFGLYVSWARIASIGPKMVPEFGLSERRFRQTR